MADWWTAPAPRRSGKLDVTEWDRSPMKWQRYRREVQCFIKGTKADERQYTVSRLLPGLSGAARETVVMWNAADFERADGGELLLKRLASTALVRRPLPDANAALDRYLDGFRR